MLTVCKEAKREKLLQYATRVWQITDGDDDTRIDTAIEKTRAFFESVGVKTRLADYGVTTIEEVLAQLEAHRMTALGERRDVNLAVSRQVLELAR